jgi:prevent-host-death family protein
VAVLNVTDARACLPELLDRVDRGEEVTITRHGRPVAVLVAPRSLRRRRADAAFADAEALGRALDAVADLDGVPPLTPERADELVAGIRDERSRALDR